MTQDQKDTSNSDRQSTIYIGHIPSTIIGPVWVAVSARGLVAVDWDMPQQDFVAGLRRSPGHRQLTVLQDEAQTATARRQLSEYLAGERTTFDLPIDWSGMTPFQQSVLRATCAIPYGETSTYGAIAREIGRPRAARAVGRAQATNPMPLVIPCHRVLGSDGGLHGYDGPGGVAMKAKLLELEKSKPR